MGRDHPDGTIKALVTTMVVSTPTISLPTTEAAAGNIDRYVGTDTTYQTLASWTVAALKTGELKEILILSDNYAKTILQITIAGTVFKADWTKQNAMPLIFEDLKLAAAAVVLVEVKSSDGTSITVDCAIVGKEVG